MNSLDSIIAITALLAALGVILFSINTVENSFSNSSDTLIAKIIAITCATTIDSMYSNSANNSEQEINCMPNEFTQKATYNNTTKEAEATTKTAKEFTIEVKLLDHYFD